MLKLEHVSKRFGDLQAVNDVSFEVNAGEVLGFLGVNGAGKSTTMRMLAGYLAPDSGRVTIGGYDMGREPVQAKGQLGYLPENAPVYGDMKVEEFLIYCAGLRGARGKELNLQLERVIDQTGLEVVRHQRIDTLSKGYRHRTCLAQALLHNPDGLILDEPTDGMDPAQKVEVRRLIKELGQSKAIIVSTHLLDEVESICTRVVVIDHGEVKFDLPISDVRGRLGEFFGGGVEVGK